MIEVRKAKSYEMLQGCNTCRTTEMVVAVLEVGTEYTRAETRLCKACFKELKSKITIHAVHNIR